MFGLAFSNAAMSSSHSLCWTGCCDAGGAQSMLIVTGADEAAEVLLDALLLLDALVLLVLLVLAVLLELLLVQAAAVRAMPATAATATIGRKRRW
jgi:hypothetical protein